MIARLHFLAAAVLLALPIQAVRAQEVFGRGPAPSLARAAAGASTPDSDGFIRRWLVLEPIAVNGQLGDAAVRTSVGTEYFPGQLSVLPGDGDTVTVAGEPLTWHAVDTTLYNLNLFHFAYALEKPTSNVLFWAVTIVDSPREMHNVRLAIGSNAASIWWVNGEEVISIYNDRQTVIDDGVSPRITLRAGRNIIRAAIINAGGATDFCARFLDASYQPVTDVSVRLD